MLLSVLQTIFLIRSLYVKPQSIASTSNTTFWSALQRKQSESFLSQSEHLIWVLRPKTLITQYLHLGVFLWKQYVILASYKDFWKLQSFWSCTPLLTPNSLSFQAASYWNCHLHRRFVGAGFANIPPTFLISCEVQTRYPKTLKYSEQYIRDHLSGIKVRIWICSEYDTVFNFSCIALCKKWGKRGKLRKMRKNTDRLVFYQSYLKY